MTNMSTLPFSKRIKRATVFRSENLAIGVMRIRQSDDVPSTQLRIEVDEQSRQIDMTAGDEVTLDSERKLTLDSIDLESKLPAVHVTVDAIS